MEDLEILEWSGGWFFLKLKKQVGGKKRVDLIKKLN